MSTAPPPLRSAARGHPLVVAAGFALLYFASARLGYWFSIRPSGIAILWPPSGVMLAALTLLRPSLWGVALAGGFLGNVAADLMQHLTLAAVIRGGAANAIETALAATIFRTFAGSQPRLSSLREVMALVLGAAVLSNAVTALFGATVLSDKRPFLDRWFVWWAGDGLGMLVLTPVVLTWRHQLLRRRWPRPRALLEMIAVLVLVGGFTFVVLTRPHGSDAVLGNHPYFVFPLLFWAALRFGPWGAATGTLIVTLLTVWNASHGSGPLLAPGPSRLADALGIYAFLSMASLSSLIPASILSERRRTEHQLGESERRFRQIAEHVHEVFFVADLATRRPLYVNPVWAEIWGRPLGESRDPDIWRTSLVPEDASTLADAFRRVAAGESVTTMLRVLRPDGMVRTLRARAFPVRDGDGPVYRLAGVLEDITDQRLVEERLRQSQKLEAMGRLAGGVAHDFNNLLTVIFAEAELLAASRRDDRTVTDALAQIHGAGERAAALTRQLLAFSRQQVVEPVALDFTERVTQLTAMLRRLIGEDVALRIVLTAERSFVRADPGQIDQIITNLVVNARDAMPSGGRLTLETIVTTIDAAIAAQHDVAPGRYVVLAVSDTGSGIPAAILGRIFEPFFTTKAPGRGTGLGLATSYGIARQAGGNLTVYSEVGVGTTFRLYLPLLGSTGEGDEGAREASAHGGTETILLVEDERGVRDVALRMLQSLGYRVLSAADAMQARQLLAALGTPFDLLLTDVVLPGTDGRTFAAQLRAERPTLRVLFMSGYTGEAMHRYDLDAPGVALLQKPFTHDALARAVRAALDAPDSRREPRIPPISGDAGYP